MTVNIQQFLGIDYSTSISKQERWQHSGVRAKLSMNTGNIGLVAPQLPLINPISGAFDKPLKQSEACLNLNIFTPDLDKKLPVMVWIHGGGFQAGSGSFPQYDGTKLAMVGNVVVVSINYRLACLGFLRLCDISHGLIPSTGNEGLGDQITALKWIQKYIHYFGGDSNNVTLFGESAGAMSIACLLASAKTKGLFHKAILQSGAAHTYSSIEKANEVAAKFVNSANQLGFTLEQFPNLQIEELLTIQAHFLAQPEVYQQFGILPFTPVIEGQILLLSPHDAIAQGSAKKITLIVGTNTDEWTFFARLLKQNITSKRALYSALSHFIETKDIDRCLTQIDEQLRSRNRPISFQNQLSEIFCEYWFTQPCHRLLANHIAAGGRGYRYKLARRSPIEQIGCTHAADIGYVFDTTDKYFHGMTSRVTQLVNEIQNCWTSFAHNGKPETAENPWPSYDKELCFLLFGHEQTYLTEHSPKSVQFWSRVSDQKLASF
jgi:para-nitrobenzyl esterase